jgi:NTP pyrophosphatase (non-canonical NTP hydrolase)
MELRELQNKVDIWIKTIGKRYFDPLTNTAILAEETGEVARLMARIYGEQSFKVPIDDKEAHQSLSDEMGDLLFVLVCIANQTGVDLEETMNRNLEKKTKRDKSRHRNNPKIN